MSRRHFDFVIVGAGIIGLTVARELAMRKLGSILVVEKENHLGAHASGRNSGVVHAGIYYPHSSMKAKYCVEGARQLLRYVDENKLPILKCGKVIVATRPENVATLETLMERATENGVNARKISLTELQELEPEAKSHEWAIWSPDTAVIESKAVLASLQNEIQKLGVTLELGQAIQAIDPEGHRLQSRNEAWSYGFLFNTAGVYADRVAHFFSVGRQYRILPFKGLYWKASEEYSRRIRRLIYPAPDVRMPFLGVHITRTVDGKVLFGPTAIPAFGRENYSLLGGLDLLETPVIGAHLLGMLIRNPNNFRSYVREEMKRYRPKQFLAEAQTLVHKLSSLDVADFYKVGIRAQLMDLQKGELVMDFVTINGLDSLHVLNAISPAFTSAMGLAPYLVDQVQQIRFNNKPSSKAQEIQHV